MDRVEYYHSQCPSIAGDCRQAEQGDADTRGDCLNEDVCGDCGGDGVLGGLPEYRSSDGSIRRMVAVSCETCGGDEDRPGSGFVAKEDNGG